MSVRVACCLDIGFRHLSSTLGGAPFLLIHVSCARVHGVGGFTCDNDFTLLF